MSIGIDSLCSCSVFFCLFCCVSFAVSLLLCLLFMGDGPHPYSWHSIDVVRSIVEICHLARAVCICLSGHMQHIKRLNGSPRVSSYLISSRLI